MEKLVIKQFKCFEDVKIDLNDLTILAGANGYGKSTAIQALLFLRHTIETCSEYNDKNIGCYKLSENSMKNNIPLNGNYGLQLGDSSYIANKKSNGNVISLGILDNDKRIANIGYFLDIIEPQLSINISESNSCEDFSSSIFKMEFYYLNAERNGPRIKQNIIYYNYPNTGFQGENVAQVLTENSGYLKIDEDRFFLNTTNPGIEFQTNEWLNEILPGVKIYAKKSIETQTAQIQIENEYIKGEPTLAPNIGFGISYVLPIIVAGLIAEKGAYLIIENPEAHLHPSAQSKIGEFLSIIANAGVKVIVETHSDHFINGVQLAVASNKIKNERVTINFFNKDNGETQPTVVSISVSEKGELSDWPKGFFDQTQDDYIELLKLRKNE